MFAKKSGSDTLCLAQVNYFGVFTVVNTDLQTKDTLWLANVSCFEQHPCRLWYGTPAQVWCTIHSNSDFIPVSSIKHLSVHVKASVNFGRYVGIDTVYIATPIEG